MSLFPKKVEYTFKWRTSLTAHLEHFHSGPKQFNCDRCSKTFAVPSSLKVHVTEKLHICPVCGRQFQRVYYFKRHQQTHKSVKDSCAV